MKYEVYRRGRFRSRTGGGLLGKKLVETEDFEHALEVYKKAVMKARAGNVYLMADGKIERCTGMGWNKTQWVPW